MDRIGDGVWSLKLRSFAAFCSLWSEGGGVHLFFIIPRGALFSGGLWSLFCFLQ